MVASVAENAYILAHQNAICAMSALKKWLLMYEILSEACTFHQSSTSTIGISRVPA
jgi:hypothetical protein